MTSEQRITSVLNTLRNTTVRLEHFGHAHTEVDEQIRQIESELPYSEDKVQPPVQSLADALATLQSARAYFYRSTYASDGASPTGTHLTWTQWYSNTLDSINLLTDAISQLKQRMIHELSSNI